MIRNTESEIIQYYILDSNDNYIDVSYKKYVRKAYVENNYNDSCNIISLVCDLSKKHNNWLRTSENNYIFDSSGIFKNRIDIQTEYFCKMFLPDSDYLINRIHMGVELVDNMNIPFNIVQKDVVDDFSSWNKLETYIIFKNMSDMAKYKILSKT